MTCLWLYTLPPSSLLPPPSPAFSCYIRHKGKYCFVGNEWHTFSFGILNCRVVLSIKLGKTERKEEKGRKDRVRTERQKKEKERKNDERRGALKKKRRREQKNKTHKEERSQKRLHGSAAVPCRKYPSSTRTHERNGSNESRSVMTSVKSSRTHRVARSQEPAAHSAYSKRTPVKTARGKSCPLSFSHPSASRAEADSSALPKPSILIESSVTPSYLWLNWRNEAWGRSHKNQPWQNWIVQWSMRLHKKINNRRAKRHNEAWKCFHRIYAKLDRFFDTVKHETVCIKANNSRGVNNAKRHGIVCMHTNNHCFYRQNEGWLCVHSYQQQLSA